MAQDFRTYTRAELEEVGGLCAGAAAGVCLPDGEVMPSEAISQAMGRALADFDERRGRAAGYSAEELSGTRSLPDCGHGHVHPRADGAKARCGGPSICSDCSRDQAAAAQAAMERGDTRHVSTVREGEEYPPMDQAEFDERESGQMSHGVIDDG